MADSLIPRSHIVQRFMSSTFVTEACSWHPTYLYLVEQYFQSLATSDLLLKYYKVMYSLVVNLKTYSGWGVERWCHNSWGKGKVGGGVSHDLRPFTVFYPPGNSSLSPLCTLLLRFNPLLFSHQPCAYPHLPCLSLHCLLY